ncbi:MAG TPA: SGNH/GDSL hydrolase family protein [Longimicrobiaceae bacterium]|nr:SGNH/GDSL hydrolase family protein [Longimicrobiaceae bacterium]
MRFRSRGAALAALGAAVLLGSCVEDGDDLITQVDEPPQGGALFVRYVALGNSITAGVQSGGLVDSLQLQAYPVLLAQRAGNAPFGVPLLARPGCPAPFTAPLTPPVGTPACALRDVGAVPPFVQNLGVPGARIADLLVPSAGVQQANLLLVGPRSPAQALIQAQPSFVSLWIGNNDALAAALGGNLGPTAAGADSSLTRLASFQASLGQLVGAINTAGPEGAVIIGVVDPVIAVPLIQPGAYFFLARDPATGRFQGKPVNANCSPVTPLGQPNPLAANLVSFQIVTNANFPEINCDPNAYPVGDGRRGAFLLDTNEQAIVRARVAAYNAALAQAAAANNWVFVDPNVVLGQLLAERTPNDATGRFQRIRKCQLLPTATNAAQFQAAVLLSCPVTGPTAAPNFFGSIFSFDGVHPSAEAHRLFSIILAQAINARYGTTLSTS